MREIESLLLHAKHCGKLAFLLLMRYGTGAAAEGEIGGKLAVPLTIHYLEQVLQSALSSAEDEGTKQQLPSAELDNGAYQWALNAGDVPPPQILLQAKERKKVWHRGVCVCVKKGGGSW